MFGNVRLGPLEMHVVRGRGGYLAGHHGDEQIAHGLRNGDLGGFVQIVSESTHGRQERRNHGADTVPSIEPHGCRRGQIGGRQRDQALREQADHVFEVVVGHEGERTAAVVEHELAGPDDRLPAVLGDECAAAAGQCDLVVVLVRAADQAGGALEAVSARTDPAKPDVTDRTGDDLPVHPITVGRHDVEGHELVAYCGAPEVQSFPTSDRRDVDGGGCHGTLHVSCGDGIQRENLT
ncbi:hypothetical protein PA7_04180 [Pseudonocardia asaccharolytica DSM 44247 = NBRC 16224]|uniref:Uncharacterized protein n=1 Tax=Pseudonocardia asaccharolytica DSM 44247 = NBRC 16224 TaxID=1123024 RepID=A0A511CVK2_9PSEU|nr:hypothetical protein PA7_04180 [Pseudonocardia asaccharolytica DSM 44247 = NBRC 16224]